MDNEFLAGTVEQEAAEGLAEAQALFDSARRQLFGVIRDVEGGNAPAVKKLQPLLAELRRATWTIHEKFFNNLSDDPLMVLPCFWLCFGCCRISCPLKATGKPGSF